MSEEQAEKKNKKISRMTVAELDAAIEAARKGMENDNADYLRHLLSRKAALSAS